MVTHSSTSRPVQCLCMAERTGCPVLTDLWSYVVAKVDLGFMFFNDCPFMRFACWEESITVREQARR
jgi:hypothetical protein